MQDNRTDKGEEIPLDGTDVPVAPPTPRTEEILITPASERKRSRKAAGPHEIDGFALAVKRRHHERAALALVIIGLVLLAAAAAFVVSSLQIIDSRAAEQQTVAQMPVSEDTTTTKDKETTVKKTEVPALTSLIGLDQAQAIEAIGHGAAASSAVPVNEQGNDVKTNVTVLLTADPADNRTGTPAVVLGLNAEGKTIAVGYSVATASLGYGAISFADAVTTKHIIENTLRAAGLSTVTNGTVVLPQRALYSTYATDGTTLVKENCAFSGDAEVGEDTYHWNAVLLYDYTLANSTGNLADTLRSISVNINKN